MRARTDRADDVAAVELADGKKVERSGEKADPCSATHRMQEQVADVRVGMYDGGDEMQDQRSAEDYVGAGVAGERRNDFCVEHAVDECGQSYDESDEWAGSADVEQRARGTYGRADEYERAECANERRTWNEEWIGGANVVMAAGIVVAEFVRQKNCEEREREGESCEQGSWMAIGDAKHLHEGVEGGGLIVGVGGREMGAGNQRSEERDEKKSDGEKKRFSRGVGTVSDADAVAGPLISPGLRRERKFCLPICVWRTHRDLFGLGDGGVFEALQFLARLEANRFSRGDADLFAGARIAADAGLARLDAEDAELAEFDALTASHGVFEGFEDGFDGLFGLGTADVCLRNHSVYDIKLNHAGLRLYVARC
jgi:hypothetical protein